MLSFQPKFPMLHSPNSAYYARIMPNYAQLCLIKFPAYAGNFRFAYYAKSNAGIFRLVLPSRRCSRAPRAAANALRAARRAARSATASLACRRLNFAICRSHGDSLTPGAYVRPHLSST